MARFRASRLGLALALAFVSQVSGADDSSNTDLFSGFSQLAGGLTNNLLGSTVGVVANGVSTTTKGVDSSASGVDTSISNIAGMFGSNTGQLSDSNPGKALEDYTGGQLPTGTVSEITSPATANINQAGVNMLAGIGGNGNIVSVSNLNGAASMLTGMNTPTTSLGTGLSWNFGSVGITNILVGLFMSYITGTSSEGSAINVVGDAFVNQDPASVAQAFTDLITSLDLTCAFQMTGSGDDRYGVNMNFRDGKEALNIQFIPSVPNAIFKFSADFPTAAAFAWSSFLVSESGKITHVDTVDGRDISPSSGQNPFRDGVSALLSAGKYEVYASPNGNTTGLNPKYLKNQFAFTKRGVTDAAALAIVYRVVMDDRVIGQNETGSVPMPKLSINPTPILGTSGVFVNIPACRTTQNNEKIRNFVSDSVATATSSGSVTVKCDYYNANNNFVFFDDAQYFKTPDENHITSCADTSKLRASSDLITVVQGYLPAASQARYSSISLVDIFPPGKNIRTVTGSSLRDYLRTRQQSAQGNYTIILARSRTVLNRCRLTGLPSDYFQVFSGKDLKFPGIVYREVMTSDYPQSVDNVRSACEDVKECSNPRFFEESMGKYYPSIAYLECKSTGELTYAPTPNTSWSDPNLPTPAPTALWGLLDANGELGACAPKGFMNVTSYQGQELYIDGQLAGKLTQNGKVVSQSVGRGWSAVVAEFEERTDSFYNETTNETTSVTYMTDNIVTSAVTSKFLPDKVVFGVKVPITENSVAFLASVDLCGYDRRSAAGWKCARGITGSNWTLPGYDDSTWMPAAAYSYYKTCNAMDTDCSEVSPGTQGIWLDKCPGSSLPSTGSLTCRLVLPQKCDLSCRSGSRDRVAAKCPDKEKAIGSAVTASPALYWLWANGQMVLKDLTTSIDPNQGLFPISPKESLVTIAVKAVDGSRKMNKGFFTGAFSLCGWEVATGLQWKCATREPNTDDWKLPTFDDSAWVPATVRDNGLNTPNEPPGISSSASWIWGPNPTDMWCRATYANPVFTPGSATTATQ